MHQVKNNSELTNEYKKEMGLMRSNCRKAEESQKGTERIREKLKDLEWSDIIKYKNAILENESINEENKLLARLYTELDAPVRNDYVQLKVFIDEPVPIDFEGNAVLLTKSPIEIKNRKVRIIKKSELIDDCDVIDSGFIYPVRNIIWIREFKTSKNRNIPNIIQSIPNKLATDIIQYCTKSNKRVLFDVTDDAISKRISNMFYQVSCRKIGINVMRHLYIMEKFKNVPMLDTRKQTADLMGHTPYSQELYRIHKC
jgi:hypothetical protein